MDFKSRAFLVGFVGDVALQLIAKDRGDIAGLKEYFEIHGRGEAATIAGGMMFGFALIYELSGLPLRNEILFAYGVSLDILFRQSRIFPSLDSYYKAMTPGASMVWGGIPMVLPNLIG